MDWLLQKKETAVLAVATEKVKVVETGDEIEKTPLSFVKRIDNEEVVCYEDRAFYRFVYENESIEHTIALVDGLLEQCSKLEQVYLMPVPVRVLIEDGYEEDKSKYESYVDCLKLGLPQKCTLLEVSEELLQHQEEELFFRSENAWTARGAYYGAKLFLEETNRACVPLEQYEVYQGSSFIGNLMYQKDIAQLRIEELELLGNPFVYYSQKNFPQLAEILLFDDYGTESRYKKPLFTPSSVNLASVIEETFDRAIVKGKSRDGQNADKYLLVICDDAGKLVVPYLKDYYAGIYVIHIYEDKFLYRDIASILEQYNITEAVWVQNAMKLGKVGYYRALSQMEKQ